MEDNKKEDWIFEHAIYIKRNFIVTICIEDLPAIIREIRKRIANLCNALTMSKTNTIQLILMTGLEALEADVEAGKLGELPAPGTQEASNWAIAQETKRINERKNFHNILLPIYSDRGEDSFIAWCEENGIDHQGFLTEYSDGSLTISQSNRSKNWLRDLLSDGHEIATSDIRELAIADGMIGNDEKDWQRICKTAERMGYTGHTHGFWKSNGASRQNDKKTTRIN